MQPSAGQIFESCDYDNDQFDWDEEPFEPNNYSIEQLHQDITEMEESEEFKSIFKSLVEKVKKSKQQK